MDIDSDSSLLAAIDMYWDIRKLPLVVSVINQPSHENKSATDLTIVDMKTSQLLIYPIENKSAVVTSVASNTEERPTNYLAYDIEERPTNYLAYDTEERPTNYLAYDTEERTADDPWGENDEIEYVGVDDEPVEPSSNTGFDYIPDTDEEDNDDCIVDDEKGCEVVEHITDLENPKIAVGVTFEDRETFQRAIRQYAILNEVEIAAPYNEAKRYRGFCKAKRCKWRIHASQLQDERTWMVINLRVPFSYTYVAILMFLLCLFFNYDIVCRLRRCLTSTTARVQVKYRAIAWLISIGLGIG